MVQAGHGLGLEHLGQGLLQLGGQIDGAGGVVAQLVQRRVEAAEVVDGMLLWGHQQHGAPREAVG